MIRTYNALDSIETMYNSVKDTLDSVVNKASTATKIGALGLAIVVGALLHGCAEEGSDNQSRIHHRDDDGLPGLTRDGSYSGALLFTYSDGIKMSKATVNFLYDPDPESKSYFSIPVWYQREAEFYNVPFNMDLTCFNNQIEVPQEFLTIESDPKVEGLSFRPIKHYDQFIAYLIENNPEINDFDFIAITHFSPNCGSYTNFASNSSFFIGINRCETTNIPPYYSNVSEEEQRRSGAHEFAHLLHASDKYGTTFDQACAIESETGEEYDGHDIMCHRVPSGSGSGFVMPPLENLVITEPTAREIGWLQ